MGEYTGRIDIARPAGEVFAFLADLSNLSRYLPTVTQAGPLGQHDGHTDVALEGKAGAHRYHDEGWIKPEPEARRMTWGSHELADYGGSLEVREASGGCAVDLRLTITPKPEVAERMQREHGSVEHGMRIAVERTLGAIKACCEEGPAAGSPMKDTTHSADDQPDSRPFGSSATLNPDI